MSSSRKSRSTPMLSDAVYPFSAMVGQDEMKLALVLSVIDSLLGGVLIMGHRGTGKSTAVRALAELLPQISLIEDCVYRCDPIDPQAMCAACSATKASGEKLRTTKGKVVVVDLPLGATEDRVCGSIDIERALKSATKAFEPGLLARANRGFLYIDEVNLLEDHLVDLLLDVAVTGRNRVEREGISIDHPARFVLIGSGNPEEGDLRPQLLDRFGLDVEITTENEPEQRTEIVERREQFESERELFLNRFRSEQEQLRRKIVRAQSIFPSIKVERALLLKISRLCAELKLDGHRGELTLARASRALAAFENRKRVTEADVKRVAPMCLRHRLRREPFEERGGGNRIEEVCDRLFEGSTRSGPAHNHQGNGHPGRTAKNPEVSKKKRSKTHPDGLTASSLESKELRLPPMTGKPNTNFELKLEKPADGRHSKSLSSRGSGARTKSQLNGLRGRYATSGRNKTGTVALDATLRAWAGLRFQSSKSDYRVNSVSEDALRFKQFRRKHGSLYILAIDTSGSMAAGRINQARELAYGLLKTSYLRRDSVAIVAFRGETAALVLSPSRSMLRAKRALDNLAIGGGTPLSAGIALAIDTARRGKAQHGSAVLVLLTDGHANVSMQSPANPDRAERRLTIESELENLGRELEKSNLPAIVIETRNRFVSSDDPRRVAEKLRAQFVQLH